MLRDALNRVGSRAAPASPGNTTVPGRGLEGGLGRGLETGLSRRSGGVAGGQSGDPSAGPAGAGKGRLWSAREEPAGRLRHWVRHRSLDIGEHPLLAVALTLVVVLGIWLRFATRSALWLDEALTVDISRQPISTIPHLLSHDGAPPLYYFLLHFWMGLFGQGDLATRSLAGLIGVINMPLIWIAGYRVGARSWSLSRAEPGDREARTGRGKLVGWAALLLFASSPYVVYYDTEARMYGLVIALVTVGLILYTGLLERPSRGVALGLAIDTAALVYTQYWGLYLVAVVGAATVVCALARGPYREACRYAGTALFVGSLTFIPWLPTFVYQLQHTGTPWGRPAAMTAVIFTVTQFAGGNSDPARALAVAYFLFMLLAVAGQATDARHVTLDLRGRPGVRSLALVALVTLVLALLVGKITGSTFADRYAAVVLIPVLLVVAYGFSSLSDARIRNGAVAVTVVFGFIAAFPNSYISRTQGGHIGAVISTHARPGDVVAFCPDQLGPSVYRTLRGPLQEVTFPRRTSPAIVDWVDYSKTVRSASAASFVQYLLRLAGPMKTIWYLWAPDYLPYGVKCQAIADALSVVRHETVMVQQAPSDTPAEVFEGEFLDRFTPK